MPAELQHIHATTPWPYTNLDGHGAHTVVCVPCDGRPIFASLHPKSKFLRTSLAGDTHFSFYQPLPLPPLIWPVMSGHSSFFSQLVRLQVVGGPRWMGTLPSVLLLEWGTDKFFPAISQKCSRLQKVPKCVRLKKSATFVLGYRVLLEALLHI